MKTSISQLVTILCFCIGIAACSKDKQVDKVSIAVSNNAGFDVHIFIKPKATDYNDIEVKRNITVYNKELNVKPGDSVLCYLNYDISGTLKYEIKADGKTHEAKTIAPTSSTPYTQKTLLIGYKVAE